MNGEDSRIEEEYRSEDDDSSSLESNSSPLVNKVNGGAYLLNEEAPGLHSEHKPNTHKDLSFLASANFSTDSIAEADEDLLYTSQADEPSTPPYAASMSFSGGYQQSSPSHTRSPSQASSQTHTRGYSVSSLNSKQPLHQLSPNSTRPRPVSALFPGDASMKLDDHTIPSLQTLIGATPPSNINTTNSPFANQGRQNNHQRRGGNNNNGYIPPPIVPPNYSSRSGSPTRSSSPTRNNKHFRSKSPVRRSSSPTKLYQPFNFKPQEIALNNGASSTLTVKPAHRKGHKYKHSSVSMNYFQEPSHSLTTDHAFDTLPVPDLHPIPTFTELLNSITKDQKVKVCWSMVHLMLSVIVFTSSYRIHVAELSTLAHLIFYDSLGCMVIILVDIVSNFNVWNSASLVYPFGLGRLEVLIGFALGASLVMVGFDLLSHIFEEFIVYLFEMNQENTHSHHHVHSSEDSQPPIQDSFIYYSVLLLTVAITLITSNYILAAEKINKLIKDTHGHSRNVSNIGILDEGIEDIRENKYLEKFNKFTNIITKNPTYMLTLLYAAFLIISPWVAEYILEQLELDINEVASLTISLLFCLTGWKLVKALGEILLLSYPSSSYGYHKLKYSITREIINFDDFKKDFRIENIFITKFNYDTFVVGIKISMKGGSVDNESNLKHEISKLIIKKIQKRQRNNFKLELTIDVDRD